MKQSRFSLGEPADAELAKFLRVTHELTERFKTGSLVPDFTLANLQKLVESKYGIETQFGILTLFGKCISVRDVQKSNKFGPTELFNERNHPYLIRAQRDPYPSEFVKRFTFESKNVANVVFLAPYRFSENASIDCILREVRSQHLFPKITLDHIEGMLRKHILAKSNSQGVLFGGSGGNYFLIRDNQDKIWLLHLWAHSVDRWWYQFIDTTIQSNEKLHPNGRLWLISKSEYIANGNDCKSFI